VEGDIAMMRNKGRYSGGGFARLCPHMPAPTSFYSLKSLWERSVNPPMAGTLYYQEIVSKRR